jgi:hypothetical protein
MNERKLQKLFESARNEPPPVPPENFSVRVASALRRDQRPGPVSLWDQIGQLFPRLAFTAAIIIGLCLVAEFYVSTNDSSSLSVEVSQISEQWLFAANGN